MTQTERPRETRPTALPSGLKVREMPPQVRPFFQSFFNPHVPAGPADGRVAAATGLVRMARTDAEAQAVLEGLLADVEALNQTQSVLGMSGAWLAQDHSLIDSFVAIPGTEQVAETRRHLERAIAVGLLTVLSDRVALTEVDVHHDFWPRCLAIGRRLHAHVEEAVEGGEPAGGDDAARAAAVLFLRHLAPESTPFLGRLLVSDATTAVQRQAAAQALGTIASRAALAPLVAFLGEQGRKRPALTPVVALSVAEHLDRFVGMLDELLLVHARDERASGAARAVAARSLRLLTDAALQVLTRHELLHGPALDLARVKCEPLVLGAPRTPGLLSPPPAAESQPAADIVRRELETAGWRARVAAGDVDALAALGAHARAVLGHLASSFLHVAHEDQAFQRGQVLLVGRLIDLSDRGLQVLDDAVSDGFLAGTPGQGRLRGYEDFREVGRGGMGLVFRARRRRDGEPVAVKVIALDGLGPGGRRELAESVRREAHVGRTLQHPGIVRVMASGEDRWDGRDVAFIVMEYVDGAPLADALRRIRDAHEAVRVARDLAEALAHAHAREVVHGDVKPGNVKLAPDGRVMLLDFGIARTTTGGQPGAGNGQRVVLVTPGWASPEQVADRVELDGRTDLFSLGLVLYCLLTGLGESPFARPSVPSTLDAVRSLELPPPSTLSPLMQRLDAARRDALDVLVATLLAKDRDRRFRTADDLVETLDQWLEWGEDAPAPLGLVALLERGPAAAHAANALERLVGEVVALVADPRAQNALRFALREFQPQLLAGRDPADVGADVKRLVRLTTIREHERGPLAAAIQAALGSGRPAPPLAEPRRPLVRGRGPDAAVAAAEA